MRERFSGPVARACLSTIVALGLTACNGQTVEAKPPATEQPAPVSDASGGDQPEISQTYFPNGTRLTRIIFANEKGLYYWDSEAWCEGEDMVEQTANKGYAGSAKVRSVGHPACADGRLDPSDFPQ